MPKKTNGKNLVVIVGKVEPELLDKVSKLAARKEWTQSQTLRHIVRTYFSTRREQAKAA